MTRSRTQRLSVRILTGLWCLTALLYSTQVSAQEDAFTLTVAPPLFQLSLQPGEPWKSVIQVVNVNPYDITIFAEPVLFRPKGDGGQPEFYMSEGEGANPNAHDLAGWITVPQGAIVVPSEQTMSIPITIQVPTDAAPGGHYAAVLIGNRPPTGTQEESALSVTSSVASLVFLRVAGEVVEQGRIREFSTEQSLYQSADARFTMRFENQGNVHIRPQGDITIYNMFGKKRGYVPINQVSGYGNVLPGSTRTYAFTWKSDTGSWDIGRYTAVATVGYGGESKQFMNASVYFYILPIVPLLEVVVGGGAFVVFIAWALRAYIRRALYIEGLRQTHMEQPIQTQGVDVANVQSAPETHITLETLIRPIQAGIVDLRSIGTQPIVRMDDPHSSSQKRAFVYAFLKEYRLFFTFIILVSLGWLAASAYFADVLTYERAYEITTEEVAQ